MSKWTFENEEYYLTGEEAQKLDTYMQTELGIPGIILMEKAAEGARDVLLDEMESGLLKDFDKFCDGILVITENGNNGGDGLALARLMKDEGYGVLVYEINGISHKSDSYILQQKMLEASGIERLQSLDDPRLNDSAIKEKQNAFANSQGGFHKLLIVDAIFGVGLHRPVTGVQAEVISWINQRVDAFVVSLDIASGIWADSGQILGSAVQADLTITFQAVKYGSLQGDGRICSGQIRLVKLVKHPHYHADRFLYRGISASKDKNRIPAKHENDNKGSAGKVLIIAGSKTVGGAALFAATAAYNAGTGLVNIFTSEQNRSFINKNLPEALISTYDDQDGNMLPNWKEVLSEKIKWADAVAIGPGIGTGSMGESLLKHTISEKPELLVMDADAITLMMNPEVRAMYDQVFVKGNENKGRSRVVFTPHMAEMQRLIAAYGWNVSMHDLKLDRRNFLDCMSMESNSTIALKDARTQIATVRSGPEEVKGHFLNVTGNMGMAKGGSGDVLTGILASFLAAAGVQKRHANRHLSPDDILELVAEGVRIHGLAGDAAAEKIGVYGMKASDIIDHIPIVIRRVEGR